MASHKLLVLSFMLAMIIMSIFAFNTTQETNVSRRTSVSNTELPTPTQMIGVGYDPTTHPVQTYTNQEYGFSFEYQKGEIKDGEIIDKELLVKEFYVCAGSCFVDTVIKVLPRMELGEAVEYEINHNNYSKELNWQTSVSDEEINGTRLKRINYQNPHMSFNVNEYIFNGENYTFAINGRSSLEIFNSWEFKINFL